MADECGTPPDYVVGVSIADKAVTLVGTGILLVKRTRPPGRVAEG